MKRFLLLALAALMLIPTLALADGCEITAQGTAVITADPDMVSVTASAEVSSGSVADARETIGAIVAKVTESLLALGVREEDIVTQNYSYYPTYDYEPDTPRLTGYRANHSLLITCRDVEMLDAVLAAVTDGGMTQVYNVSYDVSGRAELYRQALALAVEAAGEKAQRMAEPLGLTQLKAEKVVENGGYDYGVYANATYDRVASEAAVAGAGIRSGSISVSASVTVTYKAEE